MSLMRRGPPLPTLSCALLAVLALTNPSWAANDNGYPPGLFERSPEIDGTQSSGPFPKPGAEDSDRDFSGSPPAYRLPAPAAPRGAEAPDAPEPPATAEGAPEEQGLQTEPPTHGPVHGSAPFMRGPPPFVAMMPGPPPFVNKADAARVWPSTIRYHPSASRVCWSATGVRVRAATHDHNASATGIRAGATAIRADFPMVMVISSK